MLTDSALSQNASFTASETIGIRELRLMGHLVPTKIYLGVSQGSVLGPLFFDIYIDDLLLFLVETDICNYADDTTIYACDKTLDSVVARLESDSSIVIQWFRGNCMKLNADKCHLLILGRTYNQQVTLIIGDSV